MKTKKSGRGIETMFRIVAANHQKLSDMAGSVARSHCARVQSVNKSCYEAKRISGKEQIRKLKGRPLFQLGGFLIGVIGSISAGCALFEYHPYETTLDDDTKNLNAKAIERIVTETPVGDTVTFIATGDSQRFYDELDDFVTSANRQKADFVILNGDISDFGLKDEYEWIHRIMSTLNKPYVGVIGNHDLSGNGEKLFKKMYGSLNDSFVINGTKFILLNTNSREYNFSGNVPDIPWLQSSAGSGNYEQLVVVSHVPPFGNDFDPGLEDAYVNILRESGKARFSLHAHHHSFSISQPYEDGIDYLLSTTISDRMYLLIKVWDDQYAFEKIYY